MIPRRSPASIAHAIQRALPDVDFIPGKILRHPLLPQGRKHRPHKDVARVGHHSLKRFSNRASSRRGSALWSLHTPNGAGLVLHIHTEG